MLGALINNRKTKAKILALDALCANIMIADAKLNIVYMNQAVTDLLREAESDLKKELPNFSMASLIGSNIDIFHKNPAHQRNMLASLRQRHNATIWIGQRAFDLLVSPLRRGSGTIGFVVEWGDAKGRLQNLDYTAQIAAIGRSQAIIEFKVDGTIVHANENFLRVMGYTLAEVQGKHHRIFTDPEYRQSQSYADFWAKLGRGEYQADEFKRVSKDGRSVTIQGSYNPILDSSGKVVKIVKFATDVTQRVRAVTEIGDALTALAHGDLERRIEQAFTPELDKLRTDFNSAQETLQSTLKLVGRSSATIKSGTDEIRLSSQNLSERTEQQAASLEQTAAALDQITATVKRTAAGAIEARKVVTVAKADAEKSSEVVREAVDAMSRIEDSSRQISQIIGVIDEIAFQTNLLALNAGVEAARAGEAGRGFAVVASEVRALAQRSAEAAKEIKALISASTSQVAQGVDRVGQTGRALVRIVEQVGEINGVVAEISSSAQEQATGPQEVNSAVHQMDQVTQQNAAMVQETTAAANSLREETQTLADLIGKFQFGEIEAAPSQRPGRRHNAAPDARPKVVSMAHAPRGRSGGATAAVAAKPDWEEF